MQAVVSTLAELLGRFTPFPGRAGARSRAADGSFGSYAYTNTGNPVELHAPVSPGDYELRYQSDRVKGVFARRPLEVLPAEILLDAPAEVAAGTRFEVQWKGPDGDKDYLTVVPAGAKPGAYLDYKYTRDGSSLTLRAPEESGAYEVRYQSDREKNVTFASRPIRVK